LKGTAARSLVPPLGRNKINGNIMNKFKFLIGIYVFSVASLYSQDGIFKYKYELSGSVLYNYSNTRWQSSELNGINVTHDLTVQPSIGYFISQHIEFLLDLRYSLSYFDDTYWPMIEWKHNLGFTIGAMYNFYINPFFTLVCGPKIGLSWSRLIMKREALYNFNPWEDDSGWSNRHVLFPVFLAGGRIAITRDCFLLLLIEYSNDNSGNTLDPKVKNIERVSFGFGLSVFL
jgi:hypothetical protein